MIDYKKIKNILFYWLPPILWASGIFYLSSLSGLSSSMTVFWDVFWRKLFHAMEFGVLNLLFWRALYYGQGISFKKALIWSLFLTVIYAISDELHQFFVPDRQCRWQDVAQDSLGGMAISFILLFARYKNILSFRASA